MSHPRLADARCPIIDAETRSLSVTRTRSTRLSGGSRNSPPRARLRPLARHASGAQPHFSTRSENTATVNLVVLMIYPFRPTVRRHKESSMKLTKFGLRAATFLVMLWTAATAFAQEPSTPPTATSSNSAASPSELETYPPFRPCVQS